MKGEWADWVWTIVCFVLLLVIGAGLLGYQFFPRGCLE